MKFAESLFLASRVHGLSKQAYGMGKITQIGARNGKRLGSLVQNILPKSNVPSGPAVTNSPASGPQVATATPATK